jgi:predicted permease
MLPSGIRRLFRPPQSYRRRMRDLDEEIRFHIETHVAQLVARGVPESDARAAALERFGDSDDLRAYCGAIAARREPARRLRVWIGELVQDVRFAGRQIERAPAFSAIAALILALGIGANTGVFSVVNHLLISPLPFADGNRMVVVMATSGGGKILVTPDPGMINAWRMRARTVQDVVVFDEVGFTLGDSTLGPTRTISGAAVPPEMLSFIGMKPLLGRGILAADTLADAAPVVVIGEAMWRSEFAESRDVIGRSIVLNGVKHGVVGVMPERFVIPFAGVRDAIVARRHAANSRPAAIAKLRPGASIEDANKEAAAILPPRSEFNSYTDPPRIAREIDLVGRQRKQMILVLFGAVGIVLLIACANVANLLLARAWGRQREFTVRIALGAGRWRIVRQVLTESVLLASLAGALGIGFSYLVLNGVRAALPGGGTDFNDVHIEAAVLWWSVAISVMTGILFGVGPALAAATSNAAATLKASTRSSTGGTVARRVRAGLVVGEVALSVVLLASAGLMVRTLIALDRIDIGFDSRGLSSTYIGFPPTSVADSTTRRAAWLAVRDGVRAIPGVRGVTFAMSSPADFSVSMGGLEVEGRALAAGDSMGTFASNAVSPDYFSLAGIPLTRGHTPEDAHEVVINEAFARRLWPNGNAIGARVRRAGRGPWGTIVGISTDIRLPGQQTDHLNRDLQFYDNWPGSALSGTVLVRSDLPATVLEAAIRKAVHDASPALKTFMPLQKADKKIAAGADTQRFVLRLIGAFALFAMLLAGVGLHGVISYAVNQRTREIGVRVALGAQARDVTRLVLFQGLALAIGGVAVGVVGAVIATRLLRTFLYGVQPGDPVTLGVVGALLLGVALLATYAPARRAARLDPLEALRAD